MKSRFLSIACSALVALPATAAVRGSTAYAVPAETADAGGGLASSTSYQNLGSLGGVGSNPASAGYAMLSGYPAQVNALPSPALQVEQPEGGVLADGASRDLGLAPVGGSLPVAFVLRNTGSATLLLNGSDLSGPNASEFSVSFPDGLSVAPGGSVGMTVTFEPGGAGTRVASFTLYTNDADGVFELELSGTGNTAPTFTGYTVSTSYQTAATVSLSKLLAKATDGDGDAISVTAAGPVSSEGGSATLQAGSILYTPPAAFSGADSFPVTVTDEHGAAVVGIVSITVGGPFGSSTNPPQLAAMPNGHKQVTFHGIPGRTYRIERSPEMSSWSTIATLVASPTGVIEFTDGNPPQPSAFYRLAYP